MARIKQIDMCWQFLLIFSSIVSCLGDRYAFFTDLHRKSGNTRRVFGGYPVPKGAYPNTCLLLDHHMQASCSCTVIAPRWALTAAHCATSKQMYVKYTRADGTTDSAPIHLLYIHPKYRVVSRDDGAGMDVVLLHNDVGLVRTRRSMQVAPGNSSDPLSGLERDSDVRFGEEVEVLGYGRTERTDAGLELRATRLKLASCERGPAEWRHCSCARGAGRGVCAGDSGGPVMYRGRQIGVNSMGPVTCAPLAVLTADETVYPLVTNVFTALPPYVGIINDTIHDSHLNDERMIAIHPKATGATARASSVIIAFAVLF